MANLDQKAGHYLVYRPVRGILIGAGCGLCAYVVFWLLSLIPGMKYLDIGEGGRQIAVIFFVVLGFFLGIWDSFLYLWTRRRLKRIHETQDSRSH